MKTPEFEDKLFRRYLNVLGIQRQRPSYKAFEELVRAQALKIPFENISKIYFKKHLNLTHLIDFELYLDGIEKFRFGGTCYSNNFYFNQLLRWLGYNVKLCGADMKEPDVHIVNIVNIENREFLVDLGYAAPFSVPLPLNLPIEYSIIMGNDHYVLTPQSNKNCQHIELYRNGELKHGYSINPQARNIEEFKQVIADSFKESSIFMNALLLAHFDNYHFIVIHNMTMIESYGVVSDKYSIGSINQLASLIDARFGIPQKIVSECLNGLQMIKDVWN